MLQTIFKDKQRGGSQDASREGTLEFHVMTVSGKEYMHFRIGRKVAERAGLRVGDKIVFAYDPSHKTLQGEIKPDPRGWALQAVGKTDNPPLWVRITYQDERPYLSKAGVCTDVIAKGQELTFNFPDGTTFGKPEEDAPSALYVAHKEIVENGKPKGRKGRRDGHEFRRRSDEAPRTKEGKPYGRRHND